MRLYHVNDSAQRREQSTDWSGNLQNGGGGGTFAKNSSEEMLIARIYKELNKNDSFLRKLETGLPYVSAITLLLSIQKKQNQYVKQISSLLCLCDPIHNRCVYEKKNGWWKCAVHTLWNITQS